MRIIYGLEEIRNSVLPDFFLVFIILMARLFSTWNYTENDLKRGKNQKAEQLE